MLCGQVRLHFSLQNLSKNSFLRIQFARQAGPRGFPTASPEIRNETAVLGPDGAALFPEELHAHLGELSASGNGCLQISLQTANVTEYAQPLENWAPPAEQAAGSRAQPRGQLCQGCRKSEHHCAQQLMSGEGTQAGQVGVRCSQPW